MDKSKTIMNIMKRIIDTSSNKVFRFDDKCDTPEKLILEIFDFYSSAYKELTKNDPETLEFILKYCNGYRGIIDNVLDTAINSYPYIFTGFSVVNEYSRPNSYNIFDNNYTNYCRTSNVAYYNIYFDNNDGINSYIETIPYKFYMKCTVNDYDDDVVNCLKLKG